MKHLDVDKYALARHDELSALLDALENEDGKLGLSANPRHLRRRTNAYNRYRVHKLRPNFKKHSKVPATEQKKGDAKAPVFENRKMRRKTSRLLAEKSNLASSQTPAYLPTHIWHAKRMHMISRWGYMLAAGASQKCHGSRSVLHKLKTGCVMHDASYNAVLQISATQEAIFQLLSKMSDTAKLAHAKADKRFLSGRKEFQIVLHHSGQFPAGAIAPASLTLCPQSQTPGSIQSLFMWVHLAAVAELEAALQSSTSGLPVNITNWSGKLGQIWLWGPKADAAMGSVLKPAELPARNDGFTHVTESHQLFGKRQNAKEGYGFVHLSQAAVLHLQVRDPRAARPLAEAAPASQAPVTLANEACDSLLDLMSGGRDLPPAASEQEVSQLRHQARKEILFLSEEGLDKAASLETLPLCPTLAIRTKPKGKDPAGWNIICPTSWVLPFWVAFALTGATPAGQKELLWIEQATSRLPFPQGFPDTNAGLQLSHLQAAEDKAKMGKRPKGLYPCKPLPDWGRVGQRYGMESEGLAEPTSTKTLLPTGSYIGRSLKVLQAALPALLQPSTASPAANPRQDHGMPDAETQLPDSGDVKMAEIEAEGTASIVKEPDLNEACYVYMRLTFFPQPGTAELNAAVFAPLPSKAGLENPASEARETEEHEEQKGLSLPAQKVSTPKQNQKGQSLAGSVLLGYVVLGEINCSSGLRSSVAVLRADLLARMEFTNRKYEVLVQNPLSNVAHVAKAVFHINN